MGSRGTIEETYAAALQHDIATVPPDAYRLGVVRRPLPWLLGAVDENEPALGPPEGLLSEFRERYETLATETNLDEATAHNLAIADISYRQRYLEYLKTDSDAQSAIESVRSRVLDGADIVFSVMRTPTRSTVTGCYSWNTCMSSFPRWLSVMTSK